MTIFFCIIIAILFLGIILINFSYFKIDIKELEIKNKETIKFNVKLSLNLFNKIKWLQVTINKKTIKKLQDNGKTMILNKILDTKILKDYKILSGGLFKNWKKIFKIINKFEIENLKLKLKIGTKNASTTAYIVGIISSLLSIILARKTDNPKYSIKPIYNGKNYIYLSINCIFTIKLVHIMHISKKEKGKEVYQNNGRTSNRRSYANSHG